MAEEGCTRPNKSLSISVLREAILVRVLPTDAHGDLRWISSSASERVCTWPAKADASLDADTASDDLTRPRARDNVEKLNGCDGAVPQRSTNGVRPKCKKQGTIMRTAQEANASRKKPTGPALHENPPARSQMLQRADAGFTARVPANHYSHCAPHDGASAVRDLP